MGDGSYLRFMKEHQDKQHKQSLQQFGDVSMPDMSYDDETLQTALAKTRQDFFREEYQKTNMMFGEVADETNEYNPDKHPREYSVKWYSRAGKTQKAYQDMLDNMDSHTLRVLIGQLFINRCRACGRAFIDYKRNPINECVDCRH